MEVDKPQMSLQELYNQMRSTPRERKLLMALNNGKPVDARQLRRLARDGWLTEKEEKYDFSLKAQLLLVQLITRKNAAKKGRESKRVSQSARQTQNT